MTPDDERIAALLAAADRRQAHISDLLRDVGASFAAVQAQHAELRAILDELRRHMKDPRA